MDDLKTSINQYSEQLLMVNEALRATNDNNERDSLRALQSELEQLIQLTQETLNAQIPQVSSSTVTSSQAVEDNDNELDKEYALFMQEMAESETADKDKLESSKEDENNDGSDIEDELATLLGMKCAVYHTHKWGGQPSLHNAMVSAVVPRQDNDQFADLQVRVLFTHPTHTEMLPCPFYLNDDCKFDDEKCRYSHGAIVQLSNLKEAIEPSFDSIRIGSRILLKLKAPDEEDISLTKKSTEKYHLWHRAIVKHVDLEKKTCIAKLEHGVQTGEKRKGSSDELFVKFEEIFPLNNENEEDSDSGDSISDTEYPESKSTRTDAAEERHTLLVEQSLQYSGPAIGEWERHTRGIGSKLMLSMGYVPGAGLGARGAGRVQPVTARVLPVGTSLDHCMAISERAARDPLKVEQKLQRLQKKEEERNKRAYERAKEKERRNVFNFLNRTLGDKSDEAQPGEGGPSVDIKQSTSKDLNIERFKITEDTKRIEKEIIKLNSSLARHPSGSNIHNNINMQISERNKELNVLKSKEGQIDKEQSQRKNKEKMTVF